jgi:hypothetical protein
MVYVFERNINKYHRFMTDELTKYKEKQIQKRTLKSNNFRVLFQCTYFYGLIIKALEYTPNVNQGLLT